MSVTFSAGAAEKIKRATERMLNSPPRRTGERTESVITKTTFWGLNTGVSLDGLRFTFLRV